MKLSFEWLCDFADFGKVPFDKIHEKISLSICEVDEVEDIENDKILVIDNKSITHRPDLWSHFGFARELAAQLNLPISYTPYQANVKFSGKPKITVLENTNAHSYYACEIEGIQVKPSVSKFVKRLEKCGIRSISNIVDTSNYVMLEMGQPTHFFDKDTLITQEISVEKSHSSELECLDELKRNLDPEVLVIASGGKPIAIAGIMGGKHTEVSDKTKTLVLESAVFRREDIRKGIKKMGLRTEAAIRYEKGLDPNTAYPVLLRTIELLRENGCSELNALEPVGFIREPESQKKIQVSYDFLYKKLGKKFPESTIQDILKRLGFAVSDMEGGMELLVPKYRQNYDVTIPEDIVEEVGRSLGYAELGIIPLKMDVVPALLQEGRSLERVIKRSLAHELGYQEVYNYSFASESDIPFEGNADSALKILNQMPEDFRYLRTSTYPSILNSLLKNIDRFEECRIFELGRTYQKQKEGLGSEKKFFTIGVYKNRKQETFIELENDLLQVRSDFEVLFSRLNLGKIEMKRIERDYLHPKSSMGFFFDGKEIAELGFLHPEYQKKYGFKKRVLIGKMEMELILSAYLQRKRVFQFKVPSQFPQASLDISLVLQDLQSSSEFAEYVWKKEIPELEAFYVHSIFKGEGLGEGKKSVTYRAELMNYTQTFTQARVHEITETLLNLAKEQGFSVR